MVPTSRMVSLQKNFVARYFNIYISSIIRSQMNKDNKKYKLILYLIQLVIGNIIKNI